MSWFMDNNNGTDYGSDVDMGDFYPEGNPYDEEEEQLVYYSDDDNENYYDSEEDEQHRIIYREYIYNIVDTMGFEKYLKNSLKKPETNNKLFGADYIFLRNNMLKKYPRFQKQVDYVFIKMINDNEIIKNPSILIENEILENTLEYAEELLKKKKVNNKEENDLLKSLENMTLMDEDDIDIGELLGTISKLEQLNL